MKLFEMFVQLHGQEQSTYNYRGETKMLFEGRAYISRFNTYPAAQNCMNLDGFCRFSRRPFLSLFHLLWKIPENLPPNAPRGTCQSAKRDIQDYNLD